MSHEPGSAVQQPGVSEGQLEPWTGELVPNEPHGWQTDPKMYGLVPTFGCQLMTEVTK